MRRLLEDTLNQLYAEIFSEINAAESIVRTTAIKAFSFFLCMQESLSPRAFLAVMSRTDPSQKTDSKLSNLLKICFNLVVLDSKLSVLRFGHVSVQDFLEIQPELATNCATDWLQ